MIQPKCSDKMKPENTKEENNGSTKTHRWHANNDVVGDKLRGLRAQVNMCISFLLQSRYSTTIFRTDMEIFSNVTV